MKKGFLCLVLNVSFHLKKCLLSSLILGHSRKRGQLDKLLKQSTKVQGGTQGLMNRRSLALCLIKQQFPQIRICHALFILAAQNLQALLSLDYANVSRDASFRFKKGGLILTDSCTASAHTSFQVKQMTWKAFQMDFEVSNVELNLKSHLG